MKTNEILVDNHGSGMDEALREVEKFAVYNELSHKDTLRLRLLAEEMMGMVRSIAGDFQACFWAEGQGRVCRVCLNADLIMDAERRRELLAVARSGKNARAKGFMGKIRDILENCMCSYEEAEQEELAAGIVMPFGDMGYVDPMFSVGFTGDVWSMQKLRDEAAEENGEKAEEVRDELEKSIVARLADDIRVGITGDKAEVVIEKTF
ncbi:MAG: hypothetical protein K6E83_10860 [Clostridium sp.]|nr:hypothetical protein [Clostridium sp.]